MPRATSTTKAPARAATKPPPQPELDLAGETPASTMSSADFFAPIEEVLDYVKIVLWGREGAGKTTSAAKLINYFPDSKGLIINAEGGLKKVPLRKRGVDLDRLRVFPNRRAGQTITFESLLDLHKRIAADLDADPEAWAVVVIDSATEIYQTILEQVQRKRVRAAQRKGLEPDVNHVDLADYGDMAKIFRDILRKFRDLPCHVVITALERRDIDADTSKPMYGPAVSPALQTDLLGYMDFALYLKTEDEDGPYRALTSKSSRYRVKDRYDVLPRVMVEPTCDRIIAYANGDLEPETDEMQDLLPADPAPKKSGKKPAKSSSSDDEDESDDESDD